MAGAWYTDSVNHTDDDPRIQTLIGEAFKAIVATGAPANVIAAVSLGYSIRVNEILGTPESAPGKIELTPALETVIRETVARTVAASEQARGRAKNDPATIRVNVKVGDRRTSVTLARSTFADVTVLKGSPALAKLLVQQVADELPADGVVNRSEWIDKQLNNHLLLGHVDAALTSRH
ncbi:hypothetical protein Rfer_4357 (plasmid) [Rhodoferax ferrireducens T118]|uniref:Uncharacterized protein n=1 Tax=Albidiferax ferrireducens (strain ATCC BAA-621 / DSM 15236 / T118) TaxID=338969 RepID=Q21QA2_ALBFT|nr:hypothetical protein Rfer_4357 [Rhodoferax ferrireducens T118]